MFRSTKPEFAHAITCSFILSADRAAMSGAVLALEGDKEYPPSCGHSLLFHLDQPGQAGHAGWSLRYVKPFGLSISDPMSPR